ALPPALPGGWSGGADRRPAAPGPAGRSARAGVPDDGNGYGRGGTPGRGVPVEEPPPSLPLKGEGRIEFPGGTGIPGEASWGLDPRALHPLALRCHRVEAPRVKRQGDVSSVRRSQIYPAYPPPPPPVPSSPRP